MSAVRRDGEFSEWFDTVVGSSQIGTVVTQWFWSVLVVQSVLQWMTYTLHTVWCMIVCGKTRGNIAYVFYFLKDTYVRTLTYSILAYVNKIRIRCNYNIV